MIPEHNVDPVEKLHTQCGFLPFGQEVQGRQHPELGDNLIWSQTCPHHSSRLNVMLPIRHLSTCRSAVWPVHDGRWGWRVVYGQHRCGHCRRDRGQSYHRRPDEELGLLLPRKLRGVRWIFRIDAIHFTCARALQQFSFVNRLVIIACVIVLVCCRICGSVAALEVRDRTVLKVERACTVTTVVSRPESVPLRHIQSNGWNVF